MATRRNRAQVRLSSTDHEVAQECHETDSPCRHSCLKWLLHGFLQQPGLPIAQNHACHCRQNQYSVSGDHMHAFVVRLGVAFEVSTCD